MYLFEIDNPVTVMDAPVNAEFWSFLKIGMGGYLTSRGVEKSVAWWKSK